MHPILARGARLALYQAVWSLAGILLAGLLRSTAGLDWSQSLVVAIPLTVAYGFVCLSAWYVSRTMPLAATGRIRLTATALTAASVSSAVWLGLSRLWLEVLARRGAGLDAHTAFARMAALVFGFGVLLYLLSLAVSHLIGSFEQAREIERRALEVQVLAREAELQSLRAQIDPHFLFNSLHSINALTATDAAAARRMCVLLADFLRESLALGGANRIPLARELHLAARFLDIERVRFGERLDVSIHDGDAGACLVPPLLLQPVVENAVTHGVAHVLAGGTIRIAVSRSTSMLSIVVENPCDEDRPRQTGTGVGLANVRARLRALYGPDARMASGEHEGIWRVEMSLPLEAGSVGLPGDATPAALSSPGSAA